MLKDSFYFKLLPQTVFLLNCFSFKVFIFMLLYILVFNFQLLLPNCRYFSKFKFQDVTLKLLFQSKRFFTEVGAPFCSTSSSYSFFPHTIRVALVLSALRNCSSPPLLMPYKRLIRIIINEPLTGARLSVSMDLARAEASSRLSSTSADRPWSSSRLRLKLP